MTASGIGREPGEKGILARTGKKAITVVPVIIPQGSGKAGRGLFK